MNRIYTQLGMLEPTVVVVLIPSPFHLRLLRFVVVCHFCLSLSVLMFFWEGSRNCFSGGCEVGTEAEGADTKLATSAASLFPQ